MLTLLSGELCVKRTNAGKVRRGSPLAVVCSVDSPFGQAQDSNASSS